jgi:hypothetical protein
VIVDLGRGIAVNPDHVVSVTRDYHEKLLLVRTVDGATHEVEKQYSESIYDAEARVLKLLNPPAKEPRDEDERSG